MERDSMDMFSVDLPRTLPLHLVYHVPIYDYRLLSCTG